MTEEQISVTSRRAVIGSHARLGPALLAWSGARRFEDAGVADFAGMTWHTLEPNERRRK